MVFTPFGQLVQVGLPSDAREVEVHKSGEEDVRLTTREWTTDRRVYMLVYLARFWQEHARGWIVHLRQHLRLTKAGIDGVQEYRRQRPVRTWVRQVDQEFEKWKRATTRLWDDSVIVVNYISRGQRESF